MPTYYRSELRNLTFRELWNFTRSWRFLLAVVIKLLRIPLSGDPIAKFETIRELEVDLSELKSPAKEIFSKKLAEWRKLGFGEPFIYRIETLGDNFGYGLAMLHSSRQAISMSQFAYDPSMTMTSDAVESQLNDVGRLITTNSREYLRSPFKLVVNRKLDLNIQQIWESHQETLNESSFHAPEVTKDREAMIDHIDHLEQSDFQFHIDRGYYVPMTEDETLALMIESSSKNTMLTDDYDEDLDDWEDDTEDDPESEPLEESQPRSDYDAVLNEISKQQEEQSSWLKAAIMLFVSVIFFSAAGAAAWSAELIVPLLFILFIHEMGHYFAMRLFRYRDVKMFFIPFFGAAVSGRHYNVAGWKKALVALSGPTPSILLAIPLTFVAAGYEIDWLLKAISFGLIINVLNLLPILPLDGGKCLQAILFCRSRFLDASFRCLAILVLGYAGIAIGDYILLGLAVVMLLTLGPLLKINAIAQEMRKEQITTEETKNDSIPTDTAIRIIENVRGRFSQPLSVTIQAKSSLQVFELLNARPPGLLGSLALLLLHFSTLIFGCVLFVVVVLIQRDLQFTDPPATQVSRTVPFDQIESFQRLELSDDTLMTMVHSGTLAEPSMDFFDTLKGQQDLPINAAWMNDLLFVTYSFDQPNSEKVIDRLIAKPVLETGFQTLSSHLFFTIQFQTPDETTASRIKDRIDHYALLPARDVLIPPWSNIPLTDQQHRARETWHQLIYRPSAAVEPTTDGVGDDNVTDPSETAETIQQLTTDDLDAGEELEALLARLRSEGDRRDQDLVSLFESQLDSVDDAESYQQFQMSMAARAGTFPNERQFTGDSLAPTVPQVTVAGTSVSLTAANFLDPARGLPAFFRWIQKNGCSEVTMSVDIQP